MSECKAAAGRKTPNGLVLAVTDCCLYWIHSILLSPVSRTVNILYRMSGIYGSLIGSGHGGAAGCASCDLILVPCNGSMHLRATVYSVGTDEPGASCPLLCAACALGAALPVRFMADKADPEQIHVRHASGHLNPRTIGRRA